MHQILKKIAAASAQVNGCIHSYRTADKCGKPVVARSHGWLCEGHYQQQQASAPAAPRKAQPKWKGLIPQNDESIIADIIATDARVIREGNVSIITRGAMDPVSLRVLEEPTVH